MKPVTKILAGGVFAAALVSAAPASAQYYPQPSPYGYGYGAGPGNVVGQVLNQVLGGGYGQYGYGNNPQLAVSQCTGAVQARLSRSYGGGYGGYGYGDPYGYNQYGYNQYNNYSAARVLGISRVEPRSNGGLTVRGVATTGRSGGYGYTPNSPVDLTFRCRVDYRGYVTDVDIDRATSKYGSYTPYSPGQYDYSQYGYRRY